MLMYRKSNNLEVIGYLDFVFARCVDTKKSTFWLCISFSTRSNIVEKCKSFCY